MVFIQNLNRFYTTTKNTMDIEFINSNCNKNPPNNFTIPCLFYTNKLVQKHNENVFTNTLIFKAMDTNHQSCPSFYKFSNGLNKTTCLHFIINIKIYMLVELCAGNYATSNVFVNGANDILKHQ
jgi:hypothetical protein